MISLAEILRRHWPSYVRRFGADRIPAVHHAAVEAILSCHTPQRGGCLYGCRECGERHFAYHGCDHRLCPQCGQHRAAQWLEQQITRLLPVPYFLVTCTVPQGLRPLFRKYPRQLYTLFFSESAGALQDVASRPRYLGGSLGMMGVLHTWTRRLHYHPHLHYLVPGGIWTPDGNWRRVQNPEFLLPAPVIAARLRSRFRQALQQDDPEIFRAIAPKVWRQKWVLDLQAAGSGENVLRYLARYVTRSALSSARLLGDHNGIIEYQYQPSGSHDAKTEAIPAHEFIQRFLQHTLPKGFRRLRTFGFLSPAARDRYQRIRRLLGVAPAHAHVFRPRLFFCPSCQGPMQVLIKLPRAPP